MVAPAMLNPLRLACTRVEAVAKIHDLLHAQGYTGALEFGAYVRVLCASSAKALGTDRLPAWSCQGNRDGDRTHDARRRAGARVTELVTNIFRHGFGREAPGRYGAAASRMAASA